MSSGGLTWGPEELVLVLSLSLLGCGPIDDVALREGAAAGTGAVTFRTKLGGTARVRFGPEGGPLDQETPAVPTSEGRVPVIGLPTGRNVELVVVVEEDGKVRESKPVVAPVSPPAGSVLGFEQTVWEPSLACDPGGYVLFTYIQDGPNGIGIVDREGNYVFSLEESPDVQIGRVRPGLDGKSLLYNVSDAGKVEDVAFIHRIDLLGNPIHQTRTLWGHHDFVETSEGRFAWLGYDFRDIEAPPNDRGVSGEVCVGMDTLRVGDEGAATEADSEEIWNGWDPADFPPGPYEIPPDAVNCAGGTCRPAFLRNGCYEFGHGNSLAYVPEEDAFYTNWRWVDTTLKVTGSGELAWLWGGPHSDFALDPATSFEHSHFSDVWPGGMLMFDNRVRDEENIGSRLVEYTFDDTGYAQVWEHREPEPKFENILGDVRRIPIEGCDNLLVSWSGQAKLQEITRGGQVAWEIKSTLVKGATGRVYFVPDPYDLTGLERPE